MHCFESFYVLNLNCYFKMYETFRFTDVPFKIVYVPNLDWQQTSSKYYPLYIFRNSPKLYIQGEFMLCCIQREVTSQSLLLLSNLWPLREYKTCKINFIKMLCVPIGANPMLRMVYTIGGTFSTYLPYRPKKDGRYDILNCEPQSLQISSFKAQNKERRLSKIF